MYQVVSGKTTLCHIKRSLVAKNAVEKPRPAQIEKLDLRYGKKQPKRPFAKVIYYIWESVKYSAHI